MARPPTPEPAAPDGDELRQEAGRLVSWARVPAVDPPRVGLSVGYPRPDETPAHAWAGVCEVLEAHGKLEASLRHLEYLRRCREREDAQRR